MRRIYGCGSGKLQTGCHAAQAAAPMQLGTQPLMEASGCAAAAGAAAALGGSEVDPAVKGCLPSHGAVDQQQCLRQAALSSPGLDSGSALEEEGGQVAPGRCSQAAGKARPQQPHRVSSDPDHTPGVSSESLPAEAGSRLSHSRCGQAEEGVRLQRPPSSQHPCSTTPATRTAWW